MSVTICILKATDPRTKDVFLAHNRTKFDVHPGRGGEFRFIIDSTHRNETATAKQLLAIVTLNYDPPEGLTKHTANILIQKLRGTFRAPASEASEGEACLNKPI